MSDRTIAVYEVAFEQDCKNKKIPQKVAYATKLEDTNPEAFLCPHVMKLRWPLKQKAGILRILKRRSLEVFVLLGVKVHPPHQKKNWWGYRFSRWWPNYEDRVILGWHITSRRFERPETSKTK